MFFFVLEVPITKSKTCAAIAFLNSPFVSKYYAFTFRIESIDKMESDFKNCHMFLVTILNKAVCRGSFPHCK